MRPVVFVGTLLAVLAAAVPASADSPPLAASGRAQSIERRVHEVLAEPAFSGARAAPPAVERMGRALRRAIARVVDWLRGLVGMGTGGALASGDLLARAVLVALAALMAAGGVWAARRWPRPRRHRGRPATGEAPSAPTGPTSRDPDEWLARAMAHAARRDYRAAYRAAFMALLRRLDAVGAVRYDASMTNGDVIAQLRHRPREMAVVQPIAADFDARWYGGLPIGERDYLRCSQAAAAVGGPAAARDHLTGASGAD